MSVYCGIAADINNNLETFYYIKIGTTINCPVTRCNNQRLKYLWSLDIKEHIALDIAERILDKAPLDYSAAGYTESFGKFNSPKEAIYKAFKILFLLKLKHNKELHIQKHAKQYAPRFLLCA